MNYYSGRRLKELRIEEGLSEKELAKILGVQKNTIKSWEEDKVAPTPSQFVLICLHFNVSYNYLIGFSESRKDN